MKASQPPMINATSGISQTIDSRSRRIVIACGSEAAVSLSGWPGAATGVTGRGTAPFSVSDMIRHPPLRPGAFQVIPDQTGIK